MASSTRTVHTLPDTIFFDGITVILACVLASSVAVEDGPLKSRIGFTGIVQGLYAQCRFHIRIHRQPKNSGIEAVKYSRNVEYPIFSFQLCDICYTLCQWLPGMEIPFYKVIRFPGFTVCFCESVWSALGRWLNPISSMTR